MNNSQPFGKKFQKTVGGDFLTHTVYHTDLRDDLLAKQLVFSNNKNNHLVDSDKTTVHITKKQPKQPINLTNYTNILWIEPSIRQISL